MKEFEELEKVGDVHYEVFAYGVEGVEVLQAPLNIEDALEMALDTGKWDKEEITVIRQVRVEKLYFPNSGLKKD